MVKWVRLVCIELATTSLEHVTYICWTVPKFHFGMSARVSLEPSFQQWFRNAARNLVRCLNNGSYSVRWIGCLTSQSTIFQSFMWRHKDEKEKQEAQRATYRAPEYNVPPLWEIGQGGHFCLLIGPKNTNFVEDIERRSRKCLSQSEARTAILFFAIGLKNTNLVEDVEILLPVKFRWIPFSGFRGSRKCLSQSEARTAILFFDRPNKNLVEDVEILLPVKFRWIPFSGFREVENVSANQRPGRPSCFSDRPEKHKLGRGRWDLASCQVSLNSIQRFQRGSRKCLGQSEARAAILFFRSAQKHKLGRGRSDLASCQVLLNSVQRRSRKCLSQSEARAAILFFRSARKTQTW